MFQQVLSNRWSIALILLIIECVLTAPQGYNYYSNQQRINTQRAQAQRLQQQRIQEQRRYQQPYRPTRSSSNSHKNTVSRADLENAKFLGSQNQESEGKTLNLIRRKKQQAFGGNPCYFRSANQPEGRFLWDLNVYNIYPSSYGGGCGNGYGSRPVGGGFFQNLLSLFIPGGALNPGVSVNRPYQTPIQSDPTGSGNPPPGALSDPSIDPLLDGTGSGTSTGSIGSSSGAVASGSSLSPGQLVGGVASTVNSIIQQLSGNAQPVYRRYG